MDKLEPGMPPHTIRRIGIGILTGLVTLFCVNTQATRLDRGFIQLHGKPAHHFILKDTDGKRFDFKSARGKWVFLHFWASWCGPCRKELPNIQRLQKAMHKSRLKIILINTAESEDTVFEFFGKISVNLSSLLDTDGEVTEKYKPRGLPATFLVDPEGKMQYLFFGGRPWDKPVYQDFLKRLMKNK